MFISIILYAYIRVIHTYAYIHTYIHIYMAQGSGVVRVEFDNGYSMLRSKTVKYSFDLNTLDRIAADVVAGVADVNVSV